MVPSATLHSGPDLRQERLRVFAFKAFVRFGRRLHILDQSVWKVVRAPYDADLGGGLYKYRIARPGEGTSGGGRVLIALRTGERAVLMFAWEKRDVENIKPNELKEYRELAKIYLGFTELQMDELIKKKVVVEIAQHR
jgi:hypothetical protein